MPPEIIRISWEILNNLCGYLILRYHDARYRNWIWILRLAYGRYGTIYLPARVCNFRMHPMNDFLSRLLYFSSKPSKGKRKAQSLAWQYQSTRRKLYVEFTAMADATCWLWPRPRPGARARARTRDQTQTQNSPYLPSLPDSLAAMLPMLIEVGCRRKNVARLRALSHVLGADIKTNYMDCGEGLCFMYKNCKCYFCICSPPCPCVEAFPVLWT